jgi:putative MATE family efflux protein
MQDLTKGSITRHLVGMAAFIALGLVFQTAYFVVDLFFVARLGPDALAGVSAAGSATFLGLAASQIIAVGCLSLIAQAIGRKDPADANMVFNQGFSLALAALAGTLVAGYALAGWGMQALAADPASEALGLTYLHWFIPSLAVAFPTAALGAALRGAGVVRPTMLVQSAAVLLNVVLAPVLIAGWGSGIPLGVAGAGLASSLAASLGLVLLAVVFPRSQQGLAVSLALLSPRPGIWRRIIAIGLPAAGEFFLMFVIIGIMYLAIRRFGPEAQAGYGIGARIMQSIFLPAMAVAFASAPVAGQNFGAKAYDRVRLTFRQSALIGGAIMLGLTLLCQWRPSVLVAVFTTDPGVSAVAVEYLSVGSWNFVAVGLIFTCSAMFQALGDTKPSLFSSATRLLTFGAPVLWLAAQPGTVLLDFWYLSVASVALQAVFSVLLLRREFRLKLGVGRSEPNDSVAVAPS